MHDRYDPHSIEARWQEHWDKEQLFRASDNPTVPHKYVLEMFAYPSGTMHMGHVRCYTIGDILARYWRRKGFEVLHPFGWDALGLPAENAAIKSGIHPAISTQNNIASFKADMRSLGLAHDWSREIATCDPAYYKWNQWFFLKMYERGVVYRRRANVNWCPNDQTVLANEQVIDGKCWRCDGLVVQKEIPEWAFRITAYADALLAGLDTLTEWPERIVTMQRNWIGRSEGANLQFPIGSKFIEVFTTRADTVYGATYVVLAPEHPLVAEIAAPEKRALVSAFVEKMKGMTHEERTAVGGEKLGVDTGARAHNPFTGESIPVWIANFVLAGYGTGAVMSVPAHDQRDFEFARKYGIPIRQVIAPAGNARPPVAQWNEAFVDDGAMIDSGPYTGLTSAEGRARIGADVESRGAGKRTVHYHLRDWGFSRQRYWGTPIPVVYCQRECGMQLVPEKDLPVTLPDNAPLTGTEGAPLSKVPEWLNTTCPKCGGPARREAETMDTFVDSTWYYARFLSPRDAGAPFQRAAADAWLPVDIYVGGPEHAVMHLLYFRFWTRVMREMGLVPADEPVKRLITQGIVKGHDGEKMSKSRGNTVSPKAIVEQFGADTARLFISFAGPPEKDMEWSDEQVEGMYRYLGRLWRLYAALLPKLGGAGDPGAATGAARELRRKAHQTVEQVTRDIEERTLFNTAIARLMELTNALQAFEPGDDPAARGAAREGLTFLAQLLQPFVPHVAEELWRLLGNQTELTTAPWPGWDAAVAAQETVTIAVQVNGKLRGQVVVPVDAAEDAIRQAALADEKVLPHLAGKAIKKTVFVPKRLVNFVVQ